MKFKIKNNLSPIVILAASLLTSAVPFSNAKAGENNKIDKVVKAEKSLGLTTNFIGQKENNVIIRVATSQETEQRSYLRIYDSKGELLFEDMIFAKNGVKLISVSPEELSSIRIVYSSYNSEIKKVVAINTVNETKYTISETAKLK